MIAEERWETKLWLIKRSAFCTCYVSITQYWTGSLFKRRSSQTLAVCVQCGVHTSIGVTVTHERSIFGHSVSKSNPVSTVSIILQSEQSLRWVSTGPDRNWVSQAGKESEPTASLACRIQLSHCCLLKASLAWKEWVWSWPPLLNITWKKFLAKKDREIGLFFLCNYMEHWNVKK